MKKILFVVCSLLPLELSWLGPDAVERLNVLLEGLASQDWGAYLDICASFQEAETATCFVEDGVHLSAEGCRRWLAVLVEWLNTRP